MLRLVLNSIVVVTVLPVVCAGCREPEEQYEAETDTVRGIVRLLELYSFEHPGIVVTNLPQILAAAEQSYPHEWHRRFHTFGKHTGFTNSFYEKYAFFSPGITNPWMEGELVLMNAQPFPGPEDKLLRNVVSRSGNRYFRQSLPETTIQRFFKESAVAEPKPTVMPSPPPEPPVDETSRKAAEALLEESYRLHPVPIWRRPAWLAGGLVVVLCGALYAFFRLARRP